MINLTKPQLISLALQEKVVRSVAKANTMSATDLKKAITYARAIK